MAEFLQREARTGDEAHKFAVHLAPDLGSNPPVILFLHGRGESGVDGVVQTQVGLGAAIRTFPARWPFLTIFPQKPDLDLLWPEYDSMLEAVLSSVEGEFSPDPNRRYLTGLSQGGNGTFELAEGLSWKFAAMAPICGWSEPRLAAERMSRVPTWVFHGEADQLVPASCSRAILDWCTVRGIEAKGSIYEGVDHNSWDRAYAEPLADWFLSYGGTA